MPVSERREVPCEPLTVANERESNEGLGEHVEVINTKRYSLKIPDT